MIQIIENFLLTVHIPDRTLGFPVSWVSENTSTKVPQHPDQEQILTDYVNFCPKNQTAPQSSNHTPTAPHTDDVVDNNGLLEKCHYARYFY